MGNGQGRNERLMHLMVFAGYLLAYIALQPISDAHWAVRTALRLSCLFLLPYRYWPALLLAEAIPNAAEVLPCIVDYGLPFGLVRSIPPIVLAMPIVAWCRSHLALFPTRGLVNIKVLMLCVVATSLATSAYSYIAITFLHDPAFKAKPIMALGYFIGNYIAILGVVPLVLMAKLDYQPGRLQPQLQRLASSPLILDLAAIVLPSIAAISLVSLAGHEDMRHIARMSMFLPVAWLTLKHGWRAAVAGGALAIVATCLLTASKPDPQILETQAFIALAITCLIATGARISAQVQHEQRKRNDDDNALALARRALQAHELRRRELSKSLENLALTLHLNHTQMLQQVQRFAPRVESEPFMRKAAQAPQFVFQMADSLHPADWRERGLPAALNGTIARALDEADIAYRCVIAGRGFVRMSPDVLSAAYRTACEAIAIATAPLLCSKVHLTLRAGEMHGRHWIVVRVESFHESNQVASSVVHSQERARIAHKLGAMSPDIDHLRELAKLFRGQLHQRTRDAGGRITLLLQDAHAAAESSEEPLRLWVN